MSLINDALKRAQETQPKPAASIGPVLQPAVPPRGSNGRYDFWLLALLPTILVAGMILFWQGFHGTPTPVRARIISTTVAPVKPAMASPTVAVVAPSAVAPAPVPVVAPKPLPPAYKLQSIFFDPKNPEAMINGKTVFAGSLVADARVMAIGKNSATILTATGEKKVLVLPED